MGINQSSIQASPDEFNNPEFVRQLAGIIASGKAYAATLSPEGAERLDAIVADIKQANGLAHDSIDAGRLKEAKDLILNDVKFKHAVQYRLSEAGLGMYEYMIWASKS